MNSLRLLYMLQLSTTSLALNERVKGDGQSSIPSLICGVVAYIRLTSQRVRAFFCTYCIFFHRIPPRPQASSSFVAPSLHPRISSQLFAITPALSASAQLPLRNHHHSAQVTSRIALRASSCPIFSSLKIASATVLQSERGSRGRAAG